MKNYKVECTYKDDLKTVDERPCISVNNGEDIKAHSTIIIKDGEIIVDGKIVSAILGCGSFVVKAGKIKEVIPVD